MKAMLTFLALGGALMVLAAVAIGLMISLGQDRLNYTLLAVFVVDSIAIVLLAGVMTFGRGGQHPR
jgi:hypothetical protein